MCNTKEQLKAVQEANKMLVAEVERLEKVISDIQDQTTEGSTFTMCEEALEINNAR